MTLYVGRNTTERKVQGVRLAARDTHQRPFAGRWMTPGVAPAADLEADWQQPTDTDFEEFAYRLHMDGSPEFKGHVETNGATSPSVIIILPEFDVLQPAQPTYRIGKKQYTPGVIIDTAGPTAEPALLLYDPLTGELTATWPYP